MATKRDLGCNVWWTIGGLRRPAQEVQDLLVKHGFEAEDIKPVSNKRCFSRAGYRFNKPQQNQLTRRIGDINDKAVIAVVNETADVSNEKLDYDQATTVRLDKRTGEIEGEGPLAEKYIERYKELQGQICPGDIRNFVHRQIRSCHGIPKRPSGGIYFIPANHEKRIRAVADFIAELGSGKIYIETIRNTVENRENVWESCELEVMKNIEEVMNKASRIGKRVKAIQRQEDRQTEITEMMSLYSSILGEEAKAQDVADKLREAGTTLVKKMAELQGA